MCGVAAVCFDYRGATPRHGQAYRNGYATAWRALVATGKDGVICSAFRTIVGPVPQVVAPLARLALRASASPVS